MNDDDETISLGECRVQSETSLALLVVITDQKDREVWVPKSQISDDSEVFDTDQGSAGNLIVSSWWAEKEGLT